MFLIYFYCNMIIYHLVLWLFIVMTDWSRVVSVAEDEYWKTWITVIFSNSVVWFWREQLPWFLPVSNTGIVFLKSTGSLYMGYGDSLAFGWGHILLMVHFLLEEEDTPSERSGQKFLPREIQTFTERLVH